MRTAQEMIDYLNNHDYLFGDAKTFPKSVKKNVEMLVQELMPDEDVLQILMPSSIFDHNKCVMGGISAFAITNRRMVYCKKSLLMGSPVKSVNLDRVNDLEKKGQTLRGEICIDAQTEQIKLVLTPDVANRAFPDMLQIFEDYKKQKNSASAPVTVNALSGADELKKYKDLLDAGILTQEEFDSKKKQILGI